MRSYRILIWIILPVLIGCSGFAYIEAKPLHLIGPVGFADRVERKLQAYTLNLLDAESVDFIIVAAEFSGDGFDRVANSVPVKPRRCARSRHPMLP
jgi:hypothetical protein